MNWLVLVSAIAGFIAIYKFYLQKPALTVTARSVATASVDDEVMQSGLDFHVENAGLDFAEDAHVELDMEMEMDTADEEPQVSVQGTVGPSTLEFDHDCQPHSISGAIPGESHVFSADGIIHRNKRFKLYSGGALFEGSGVYTIEYVTACRSHQPREGEIELNVDVEEGTVSIENARPFYFRRLLIRQIQNTHHTIYSYLRNLVS